MLAILSLLLQAFVPLSAGEHKAPSAHSVPSWIMTSLCLSQGAQSIDPTDGLPKQDPAKASAVCPICLGFCQAGAYLPPDDVKISLPSAERSGVAPIWTERGRPLSFRAFARARAPPLAV